MVERDPAAEPGPARALPTELELARQDAATIELRRAVDDLRRVLDVEPAPSGPDRPTGRGRRPGFVALTAVTVVGLAAAVVGLVAWQGLPGRDRPASAAPTSGPTSDGGPSVPGVRAPAPLPAPFGSVPLTGPGVDEPGTVVVAQPAGDGFLVVEQALLPTGVLPEVVLAVPDVGRLGGQVGTLHLAVADLRVALDDRPVAVAVAVAVAGADRWRLPLTGTTRRIAVSYRLAGAVLTSTPSTTGRALGLVAPLLGSGLRTVGLPLVVRPVGGQVRGVTCPDAPAALLLCGTSREGRWTADVPLSASPVVVVQLDVTG